MVGVVIISHGDMSKGMLNSAGMFFDETGLQNVTAVSLYPAESPEDFDVKLTEAINTVDTGDGVFVLCDLLGGTPCNRVAYKVSDKVKVLTGMNLSMLMELLGMRLCGLGIEDIDSDNLVSVGQDGILNYNKLLGGN